MVVKIALTCATLPAATSFTDRQARTAGRLHYGFLVGRMGPDTIVDHATPADNGV
jgi:hypothetical protein